MKKVLFALAAVVAMSAVSALSVPANAAGGYSSNSGYKASYSYGYGRYGYGRRW